MGATSAAERRLLLGSLAWAGGRGPELAPLARQVRRWPRVLRLAGTRGIAETLAHALLSSEAARAAPAVVQDRLRAALELGAARNLVLLAECSRIQGALARRGIPSVALKGAAMIAAHYPLPGARHVSDLDLLVPRARLADALAALAHEGPALRAYFDHGGRPARASAHVLPFDTAGGVSCELHFQVPGCRAEELAERLLEAARTVASGAGGPVRIPEPADCAAVACVHAFAGHGGGVRYLPRLVADLEALDATAGLDWSAVRRAAGPEGEAAVERGRALLDRARRGAAGAVFPGWVGVLAREVAPAVRGALRGPRALFPARRFMARRYGVPERSGRLLLYYLARPFLALRERLSR